MSNNVTLPDAVVKYVMWLWMSRKLPFKYIGVLANSNRSKAEKGKWVIIQSTESGKLYEVLDCDLTELNE